MWHSLTHSHTDVSKVCYSLAHSHTDVIMLCYSLALSHTDVSMLCHSMSHSHTDVSKVCHSLANSHTDVSLHTSHTQMFKPALSLTVAIPDSGVEVLKGRVYVGNHVRGRHGAAILDVGTTTTLAGEGAGGISSTQGGSIALQGFTEEGGGLQYARLFL